MISLRNGTAMAIVLSIAFVVVAVVGRDQLPGLAGDNARSATSVAIGPVETEAPGNTAADVQIGEADSVGIGQTDSTQEYAWEKETDDDDHEGERSDDHDDDDNHDGEHHDEEDDD
jgi:hypothetical protein